MAGLSKSISVTKAATLQSARGRGKRGRGRRGGHGRLGLSR